MQNTRTKISVYFMSLTVAVSCILRFFQLKNFTDSETGCVVDSSNIAYYIYAMMLISLIIAGAYAFSFGKNKNCIINPERFGKSEFRAAVLLSITFFAEFIYQAYTAFSYYTTVSYLDYIYFVPLICSSIFALLSCFYFAVFSITAKGANYDFRNFVWMHFAPVLWGISNLVIIMLKIVDTARCIEIILQFLFLVFFMTFIFSYICSLDNEGKASKAFIFSSLGVFIISVIMVVPRAVMLFTGNGQKLSEISYFGLNYLMIGIFALILSSEGGDSEKDRG